MSQEESNPWYYSISASSFLVLIVLERVYNEPLFNYSIETIPKMQRDESDFTLMMWSTYSTVGLSAALIVPFVVSYIMFRKSSLAFLYPCVFQYVVALGLIFYVMNVTKLTYHQERPFWVSKDIEAVQCTTQYGNPSGHSMFSIGTGLILWLEVSMSDQENDRVLKAWHHRLLSLLAAILFGLTIGYSRVILGVHSWNQVVFGWSLGVWIAFTFHYCIKEHIVENVYKILMAEETRFFHMTVRCVALMIIAYSITFFDFWLMDSMIQNDSKWTENITQKCGEYRPEEMYQARRMAEAGVVAIVFGSYLGIVFQACMFPGLPRGEILNENFLKSLLRFIVIAIMCLTALIPFFFIPNEGNVYLLMFFKSMLPFFTIGFLIFGVADYVNIKLGLLELSSSHQTLVDPEKYAQSDFEFEFERNEVS